MGRQLNFLSCLGRNEKTILIFRRAPRVLLLKISCARRTVDYTHARVGRRSRGPERIELFDNFWKKDGARVVNARAPRVWNFKNVKKLKIDECINYIGTQMIW